MRIGQQLRLEIAEDARSACAAASFLVENTAQSNSLDVSGRLPREFTAHRNEESHRGIAFGNCRSADIAVWPRRDRTPARVADRAVPLAHSMRLPSLPALATARCRPASPGSKAPRHDWTVGRGQQGSHFRGPRRASYRAAESGSITGMQTPACWQRSRAALCRGKLRSRAQRSSWFPCAPQSKQRKTPLVSSTEKQRGIGCSEA